MKKGLVFFHTLAGGKRVVYCRRRRDLGATNANDTRAHTRRLAAVGSLHFSFRRPITERTSHHPTGGRSSRRLNRRATRPPTPLPPSTSKTRSPVPRDGHSARNRLNTLAYFRRASCSSTVIRPYKNISIRKTTTS